VNYAALYNLVKGSFDDNLLSNVKTLVNDAQNTIISRRGWSWRIGTSSAVALVAGTQAYNLTGTSPVVTDFGGMIDVQLEITASGSRHKLIAATQQVFDDLAAHNRVNGVPSVWTVSGGSVPSSAATVLSGGNQQLLLWPIPIATAGNGVNVFLRYWRSTASVQMTADSDVPIVPVEHHMVIADLATARGFRIFLGDTQRSAQMMQDVEQRIQQMITEDELVHPPRDNRRLEYAAQPTLQANGHISSPTIPLPVPEA
jgi:hypothetical protein